MWCIPQSWEAGAGGSPWVSARTGLQVLRSWRFFPCQSLRDRTWNPCTASLSPSSLDLIFPTFTCTQLLPQTRSCVQPLSPTAPTVFYLSPFPIPSSSPFLLPFSFCSSFLAPRNTVCRPQRLCFYLPRIIPPKNVTSLRSVPFF